MLRYLERYRTCFDVVLFCRRPKDGNELQVQDYLDEHGDTAVAACSNSAITGTVVALLVFAALAGRRNRQPVAAGFQV